MQEAVIEVLKASAPTGLDLPCEHRRTSPQRKRPFADPNQSTSLRLPKTSLQKRAAKSFKQLDLDPIGSRPELICAQGASPVFRAM